MATQAELDAAVARERELIRELRGIRHRIAEAEQEVTRLRYEGRTETDATLVAARDQLTALLARQDALPQLLLDQRTIRLDAVESLLPATGDQRVVQKIAQFRELKRLYGVEALKRCDLADAGLEVVA